MDSIATDIFVGRAPANDIVLADPSISKSHFGFIPITPMLHSLKKLKGKRINIGVHNLIWRKTMKALGFF